MMSVCAILDYEQFGYLVTWCLLRSLQHQGNTSSCTWKVIVRGCSETRSSTFHSVVLASVSHRGLQKGDFSNSLISIFVNWHSSPSFPPFSLAFILYVLYITYASVNVGMNVYLYACMCYRHLLWLHHS